MTAPTGDTTDQLAAYLASARLMNQRTDATEHIDFRDLQCFLLDNRRSEQAWAYLEACQNVHASAKIRVDSYYLFINLIKPCYRDWFQLKLENEPGKKCLEFHFIQCGQSSVKLASMESSELAQRLDSEHEKYCKTRDTEFLQEKFTADIGRAEYKFNDANGPLSDLYFSTTDSRTIKDKLESVDAFFDNATIKQHCQSLGFQQLIHHFKFIRNDAFSPLHNFIVVYNFSKKVNGDVCFKLEVMTKYREGKAAEAGKEEPIESTRWLADFVVLNEGFFCLEATVDVEFKNKETPNAPQTKPSFKSMYPSLT